VLLLENLMLELGLLTLKFQISNRHWCFFVLCALLPPSKKEPLVRFNSMLLTKANTNVEINCAALSDELMLVYIIHTSQDTAKHEQKTLSSNDCIITRMVKDLTAGL